MGKMTTRPPPSKHLTPLILGTATFNTQYNADPFSLPSTAIVHRALSSGIRAFDTSPYYGPSEEILGQALATEQVSQQFPRSTYQLLTKVGRVAESSFDYSPAWVRYSIRRSLKRLRTDYLDVVYCHDVEFVSAPEVLEAVKELRRIREEDGSILYVGISGYPVETLCELAELVLQETGEPLDVVMSYANYNLQNMRLATEGLARLRAAGVDVVPNASILGMGLLRGQPVFDWHPAPKGLRDAIHKASELVSQKLMKLETVATRFGLESWLREGSPVGVLGHPLEAADASTSIFSKGQRLGVTVVGVSKVKEVDELVASYREVLDGGAFLSGETGRASQDIELYNMVRAALGDWVGYAWPSPGEGYLNTLPEEHYQLLREQETTTTTATGSKGEIAMYIHDIFTDSYKYSNSNTFLTPISELGDDGLGEVIQCSHSYSLRENNSHLGMKDLIRWWGARSAYPYLVNPRLSARPLLDLAKSLQVVRR
ncbi:L-galactose dehydrogenase (L-GalDH), putative [Talaromyces stipitatus ATCC 10500]|uniref:L-galactose dehydrogenase (L-GalDH), putative n=1 Tax=Talaromyces stipitatus (strain ATCC 10500 / CBS 375.48 / QM 6759 / NRRL 1006) TaxID=441959 RepID=B8MJG1_TALSN|nr:L-galactose dehydrogenase (L-GalDH), putative [Talaromyces stipitatus ATCC 10500]EED15161.1 L-galactose dehydrogenase (L-GalDH), putative [Talaromyces stipitatus ATCC 10500]